MNVNLEYLRVVNDADPYLREILTLILQEITEQNDTIIALEDKAEELSIVCQEYAKDVTALNEKRVHDKQRIQELEEALDELVKLNHDEYLKTHKQDETRYLLSLAKSKLRIGAPLTDAESALIEEHV